MVVCLLIRNDSSRQVHCIPGQARLFSGKSWRCRVTAIAGNSALGKFRVGFDDRLIGPLVDFRADIANHFGGGGMRITIDHRRIAGLGQIGHQPGGIAVNKAIDIG